MSSANPLCEESNRNLRQMYESAITDACLLIRRFLPAIREKRAFLELMDYDFESQLRSSV